MKYNELVKIVGSNIKKRLENSKGLAIFAEERAKFEGWLKVKICEILTDYFPDIHPEKDNIDICFDNWGIELKTVNTNYRFTGIRNKSKNITGNIESVIKDIESLLQSLIPNAAVIFIAFPLQPNHPKWQNHLSKIKHKLVKLHYSPFNFSGNQAQGAIYIGLVKGG